MSELVTVILPVHNRASTIRGSLDSVLSQTHNEIRVILVDDASTDETLGVVRETKDDRVEVVELKKNLGASAARNVGLGWARTGLVAFQDSDDLWHKRKLEIQISVLDRLGSEQSDVLALGCDHRTIGSFDRESSLAREKIDVFDSIDVIGLTAKGCQTPKLLIRWNADSPVWFDEKLHCREENEFLFRLIRSTGRFAKVSLPLLGRRVDLSDRVSTDHGRMLAAYEFILERYRRELQEYPGKSEYLHFLAADSALRAGLRSRSSVHFRRAKWWASPKIGTAKMLGGLFGTTGLKISRRLFG